MVRCSNSSPDEFLLALSVLTKNNDVDHLKIYTEIIDNQIIYRNKLDDDTEELIKAHSLIDYVEQLKSQYKTQNSDIKLKTPLPGSPCQRLFIPGEDED